MKSIIGKCFFQQNFFIHIQSKRRWQWRSWPGPRLTERRWEGKKRRWWQGAESIQEKGKQRFFKTYRMRATCTTVAQTVAFEFELKRFSFVCRWWFQGQVSTHFSTTTRFGTQDARRGDQLARRATNRILSRSAALPRYVRTHEFVLM